MSDRDFFFHNQFSGRLAPSLSPETLFEHFDHGGLWAKGMGTVVRKKTVPEIRSRRDYY
jgi:hypothetical protein